MKNTEALILNELNRLNDEVFRLYYLGYYNEAVKEANNLLLIASEKLGHQHPIMSILQENFVHMKKQPKDKSNYSNKNLLLEKKSRIEDIKRDIMVTDYFTNNQQIQEKKTSASLLKRGIIFACILLLMGQGAFATVYLKGWHRSAEDYNSYKATIAQEAVKVNLFNNELKESVLLEAPLIHQYPELPRGCEVTSLAMLLQFAGLDADKMTLAKKIAKDTTPFQRRNGKIYFGNPNDGFVGDMYSLNKPGLGVYYGPILDLLEEYMPSQTVNLTGRSFEDIYYFLSKGLPVWVISNGPFRKLGSSEFQLWQTPSGPIKVTYRMHSVLITGYDDKYIYVNDPLYNAPNRKINKNDFIEAWVQMGSQAISFLPEGKTLEHILPPKDN